MRDDWLLQRYRRSNDPGAREELVRRMAPQMRRVVAQYRGLQQDDDLYQAAAIGLTKAIDRFDPAFGVSLAVYAQSLMVGEVRRHLRDHAWSVHVARSLQERSRDVALCVKRSTALHGRAPSVQAVAEELSLTVEQVVDALLAAHAAVATSLDAPAGQTDGDPRTVADTIPVHDDRLDLAERFADLRQLRHLLDDRERRILYLRYVCDLSQDEIAREVGCSQMQVSRLLRTSVARLSAVANRAA